MDVDEDYPWNEIDLRNIEENQTYYENMVEYTKELKKYGPTRFEPAKPKSKLPPYANSKKKLVGKDLHQYLLQNYSQEDSELQQLPIEPQEKDFPSVNTFIQACVEYEKKLNNHNIRFHALFGSALEYLYWWWRENNEDNISWKEYLKNMFDISDGNARKKREVANLIHDYPKLQFVCISFNKFYSLKNDIKAMLNLHQDICKHWSEKV